MKFVLILYIYAGILANGDSVSLTNIPGFTTEASCIAAGKASSKLTDGSSKVTRFICVKQD